MDNREKVTEILEKQISSVKDEITNNKIDIADLFINIHKSDLPSKKELKDVIPIFKQMESMPILISRLSENEAKLEVLINSKSEIENTYSEECVK